MFYFCIGNNINMRSQLSGDNLIFLKGRAQQLNKKGKEIKNSNQSVDI